MRRLPLYIFFFTCVIVIPCSLEVSFIGARPSSAAKSALADQKSSALVLADFYKPLEPENIHTYILDPMRNVILAYRDGANPADLHKDLKQLLKWADQETGK